MNKLWNWYDNVKGFFMLLVLIPFVLVWQATEAKHRITRAINVILDIYTSIWEVIKNVSSRTFNKH